MITPINPHCLVIGQAHCKRFFELLSAHNNAQDSIRAITWASLTAHLDTCPACLEWQTQPQPELEEEE